MKRALLNRASMTLLSACLLGLAVSFTAYFLWQSRINTERDSVAEAQNLDRLLERYLYTTLHETDLALASCLEEYRRSGASGRSPPIEFTRFLKEVRERLPEVATVRATNADGTIVYSSADGMQPAVNIADREHFRRAKESRDKSLIIAPRLTGRSEGLEILPLARRLESRSGTFAGAVYVGLPIEAFNRLFDSLQVGTKTAIVVFDDSRRVLMRYPDPKGAGSYVGRQINSPEFVALWDAGKRSATYEAVSTNDGQRRVYTYRQIGAYPAYIMVGVSAADYLESWWREVAVASSFIVALALVLAILWRVWLAGSHEHDRYQRLLRTASDGIHILNAGGYLIDANDAFCRMLGYPREALLDRHVSFWEAQWSREQLDRTFLPSLHGTTSYFETRHRCSDGRIIEVHVGVSGQRVGDEILLFCSSRDVTAQKQAEAALRLSQIAFQHAQEAIIITDSDARILDVNPAFSAVTGYAREEALGRNPRFLQSGRESSSFYRQMWAQLTQQGFWEGEFWNRRKDGTLYIQQAKISAVRDGKDEIFRYVSLASDVTQLRDSQRRVEHLAYYDPLTNLPNRSLLSDRLQQALGVADRTGRLLAVCYLDLDGFRPVNDRWGHSAGDFLLTEVAQRLQACVRSGDTVARLGGDEFVVLIGDIGDVHEIDQAVTRILRSVEAPIAIDGKTVVVSASIGITIYPTDGEDADTLIRHADQAMYVAKQAGKNCAHLFDPEHDKNVKANRELLKEIADAIARGEMQLHYQPKVNMRDGRVVGLEALVRWRHPRRGLLTPDHFLPALKNSDVYIALDRWVMRAAIRQLSAWGRDGLAWPVSINVSGRYIQQGMLFRDLSELLAEFPDVSADLLELEILETSALEDIDAVSRVIADCSAIGVPFALDDFGTGYSSLSYFRRLPTSILKIDQSFVRDILYDNEDLAIVEGIIGLAATFQRKVIAEGVESTAHGIPLLQFGCDYAQGYGIARPMPPEAIPAWVAQWRNPKEWEQMALQRWSRADLPLLLAEVYHRNWVKAVIDVLAGKELARPAPTMDETQCRFGKWLYDYAWNRYPHQETLRNMALAHQRVHRCASSLLRPLEDPACQANMPALIKELEMASAELLRQIDGLKEKIVTADCAA